MKKFISALFQVGAVMVLLGITLYITGWIGSKYFYLIGALMVAISLIFSPLDSEDKVIRRLHIQQILGGLFLFVSSVLMFVMHDNEWILALAVSCVFLIYSTYRISYELNKKSKVEKK